MKCSGFQWEKYLCLKKNKPRKVFDTTIDEFKNQFDTTRVTIAKVLPVMEQLLNGGRLFKLNFLVVWNTIFGEITKSTTVNQKFLLGIEDDSEISNMNWCSYMLDCLKRSKAGWRGYKDLYNGPIASLNVLYTHEFNKRHKPASDIKTPVISYITSAALYEMESYLFDNGPLTDGEGDDDDETHELVEKENSDNNHIKSNEVSHENVNEVFNALLSMPKQKITKDAGLGEDYTLPPVQTTTRKRTFAFENQSQHDEVHEDDEDIPWYGFDMGTQTQEMFEYCSTQPQLTRVAVNDQFEASSKAKKGCISAMDKNIKKKEWMILLKT